MFATRTLARPVFLGHERTAAPGWAAELGWKRISQTCLGLQLLLVAVSLALYRATDIDVR